MTDISSLLERIGDAPVHPRLAGIDEQVFASLASRRERIRARRTFAVAAVAALWTGVASTALPGGQAHAVSLTAPLGVSLALAPSTLLEGGG